MTLRALYLVKQHLGASSSLSVASISFLVFAVSWCASLSSSSEDSREGCETAGGASLLSPQASPCTRDWEGL